MAHRVCLGIEVLLGSLAFLAAVACSSDSDSDHGSTDSTSSSDETAGCEALTRRRLFPIIGAFAGPDPGPCTVTRGETQYFFAYDADATLVQYASADHTDETVFSYEQGLLVNETRTSANGVSNTNYQYSNDRIRTITIDPNGAATGYEYEVDQRGYVRAARLLNSVSSVSIPTHFTYEYEDCTLQWRVAYDPNEAVNLVETLKYTYDTERRLVARTSATSEERFDYSCW